MFLFLFHFHLNLFHENLKNYFLGRPSVENPKPLILMLIITTLAYRFTDLFKFNPCPNNLCKTTYILINKPRYFNKFNSQLNSCIACSLVNKLSIVYLNMLIPLFQLTTLNQINLMQRSHGKSINLSGHSATP